jgi:hypothetical protein
MKLYAISLVAYNNGKYEAVSAYTTRASSFDEAKSIANALADLTFPRPQGYFGHGTSVVEVDQDSINACCSHKGKANG